MSFLRNLSRWFEQQSRGRETTVIVAVSSVIVANILFIVLPEIREFFEAGGPVLWGILMVTIIMWTLIIERFWFFQYLLPQKRLEIIDERGSINNKGDWFSMRMRDQMISEVSTETKRFLLTIETMMQILPLLGLLGLSLIHI